MKKSVVNKNGSISIIDCEDEVIIKPKRKELITEYIRRFYDSDDEQAIINNWIEVRDNEAIPPPADIIERRTKAYRKYQKIRKEAKQYADNILGEEQ